MNFELEADEGALTVQVVDPEGEVLRSQIFRKHDRGTVTVAASQTGCYRMRVEGDQTAGRFAFAWRIE